MQHGPHKSAIGHQAFLEEEMTQMSHKGQWMGLPYHLVHHLPNLCTSPIGVVPQHKCCPCMIVDLSFFRVNKETVPLAPSELMQFGWTIQQLLQQLVHSDPQYGLCYLIKVNISDRFYCLHVNLHNVLALAVSIPLAPDGTPLVALLLCLLMGRVSSPPYFSAVTETATDLGYAALRKQLHLPSCWLEHLALHPLLPSQL